MVIIMGEYYLIHKIMNMTILRTKIANDDSFLRIFSFQ